MFRLMMLLVSSLTFFTLPAIAQSPDVPEPGSVEAIAAAQRLGLLAAPALGPQLPDQGVQTG